MRIALLSYEYPPDTAVGGIGTYVYQMAALLHQRGHRVEVFTASPLRSGMTLEGGLWVHRVQCDRASFPEAIAPLFAQRHQLIQFSVLEAPECGAEAREVVKLVPTLPLVVKLHTPSFLVDEINAVPPHWSERLRWSLGSLRRGRWPQPYPEFRYDPDTDPERHCTLEADEISSPSLALRDRLLRDWQLPRQRVHHVPSPYCPAPELLTIPVDTQTQTVTFIGRLEIRKGILDLAAAIPAILQQHPQTRFRFVGAAWRSPHPRLTMQQYLERQLRPYRASLEFTGAVPLEQIPAYLAQTDICVFPSRWENFPNVCLEAMAAGRGIVGSCAGGMAEMLEAGSGLLVAPQHPQQLVSAVNFLLAHPMERMQYGSRARERVLQRYNRERIAELQEASYRRAIFHRAQVGSRAGDRVLIS